MKRLYFIIMLSWFCLSSTAWADVILSLPENVEVVAANGENTNVTESVQLQDGLNQIAIRFAGEFGRSFDNMELFYSDVFVATFETADTRLSMQPLGIGNESELKTFNRNPKIGLTDSNGKPVPTYVGKMEKEGFQLMRDYRQELIVFNQSESPAAIGSRVNRAALSTPTQSSQPSVQDLEKTSMAEEMLKYWYQQADDATRQRFRAWLSN